MRIKFNTGYSERRNQHYYAHAEVLDELPKVGDTYDGDTVTSIWAAPFDCEQPTRDTFKYSFYTLTLKDEDGDEREVYVAVETTDEEEGEV